MITPTASEVIARTKNIIYGRSLILFTDGGQRIGKTIVTMSDDCRDFIEHYPWPGNVRQLENVLIRAVSL
ncbi:hypothetical protein H4J64_18165, partial [Colwellia sp. BRX8-2]|uniref:hypothetical protein n=1 Tax=Colwellia sp. BRX8-2 TaxID=2759838 RepID=UPI0015F749B4